MKLEDQVCTLEQAKRLQELGVEVEHLFKWQHTTIETRNGQDYTCNVVPFNYEPCSDSTMLLPAYTVAELGEMLPYKYLNASAVLTESNLNPSNALVTVWNSGRGWRFRGGPDEACSKPMTEAQARAGMLIYLLENAIVPPSKTTEP